MSVTFVRTLIVFALLILVLRLMGKRQIGEMQPYEFIVTLIIADLACVPMADVSIPLIYGIIAVLTLFFAHQLISIAERGGDFFKRTLSGTPSIVIDKNGIKIKELKRNNMGVDDLIESMRSAGYYSLDDLDYAIFESNGKLSPLENPEKDQTATSIPLLIVNNGKVLKRNVSFLQTTESNIVNFIRQNGSKLSQVEVMTIDGNGRTYFKAKNKKYQILNFTIEEGLRW
ncbi:MAG: DUF421 domain-containing protein [Clostridia bacterium]|nr:DUF421 domain-containing protein [Clostridia bacterium]